MSINAFSPRGNTFNIAATQTASSALQITSDPLCDTYQFVNTGSSTGYVAVANNASVAAVVPAAGTPANGIPVLAGEIVIYRFVPNAWVSAICDSGKTTNLLITVGEGN